MGYGGQVGGVLGIFLAKYWVYRGGGGGVWGSGRWGMEVRYVGYGDFSGKKWVYGERGGGVWAWKGWGMGKRHPPFQPPSIAGKMPHAVCQVTHARVWKGFFGISIGNQG